MSNYFKYIVVFFVLVGCTKEEALPVLTDFSITVVDDDYSIPVQVQIKNLTTGGEHFEWFFDGANPNNSTKKNPGTITYTSKGTYTIKLTASNSDGGEETKEIEIQIDDAIFIDFEVEILNNNNPPVEIKLTNKTLGATTFQWTFEGGSTSSSTIENPENIVFTESGEHIIKLVVSNGRETHELEKIITVAEDLLVDFDWEVSFDESDYQAPVTIQTINNSIGAIASQWNVEGATPSSSTDESPQIVFQNAGVYAIKLTAGNGKKTETITKEITVFENTNLRVFNDIKLGVNSAHNTNVIGSFFSTKTGEVTVKDSVPTVNGALIDIAFFGLGSSFTYNQFISPDEVQLKTFEAIDNATHTKFINSQNLCNCGVDFTPQQFDEMVNDDPLKGLTIIESSAGKKEFDNSINPRIVLFETYDGRKGAIKIKDYISSGKESYILVDIKVQKENN